MVLTAFWAPIAAIHREPLQDNPSIATLATHPCQIDPGVIVPTPWIYRHRFFDPDIGFMNLHHLSSERRRNHYLIPGPPVR